VELRVTQLDVVDHNGTTATPRYGKTVSPVTAEELAALVEQRTAAGEPYPSDLGDPGLPVDGAVSTSFLLTMRDGVRLALDVHVPPLAAGERVPTCLRSTRYRRSTTGSPLKEHLEVLEVQRWLREGFALVLVDVRGTGASFGTWRRAWDDEQRDDLMEILDWIVERPWSDGTVGGYGTSYDGSTAHLLAATGHPAVRAVVPRFALYDSYGDVAAPGGVPLDHFIENWAAMNWALDGHPDRATVPLPLPVAGTVQPVDSDPDGSLLEAARASHVDNWNLWDDLRHLEARHDLGPEPDLGNGTPLARIEELHGACVPMWLWSSWYDGAYAAAQLRQLADPDLDVRVTIGPFAHGASMSPLGDPLNPHRRNIPVPEQVRQIAGYLRRNLTGQGADPSPASLRYYRLGDGWHESTHWPPPEVHPVRHRLVGSGRWKVDHEASTGSSGTRWHCLIGGGPVDYADGRREDPRRLVWEGPVLSTPLGITGTPVVHLDVISSTSDAALHVYLEAELPDGKVLYLTEGLLRASHRHMASATRTTSLATEDGTVQPLRVGVPEALRWELLPISVLLPVGSRVRIALAGADASLFRRVPAQGDVELEVLGSSWLDLPEQSPRRSEQDVAFDFLLLDGDSSLPSAR
jgi:predicted acyl esterase